MKKGTKFKFPSNGKSKQKIKEEHEERMRAREEGFNLKFHNEKSLLKYSPLTDVNLRQYFENPKLQNHLQELGIIDNQGHILDYARHQSQLSILEQEFKHAELQIQRKEKEEKEIRQEIQKQRYNQLEQLIQKSNTMKVKQDQQLRKEIIHVSRTLLCPTPVKPLSNGIKEKGQK